MVLAGRWEVMDRLIDGRWTHIGEPAFDAVLTPSLEQAVQVASSDGADVVLLTAPCFDSGEQPNGLPWPEDSAARLALYNAACCARSPPSTRPTVRVEDFDAMVCPGGVYTTSLDGVQIRDGDGVHIVPTPAAGQWLAGHLLPEVVQVGPPPDGRSQPGRDPDDLDHRLASGHRVGVGCAVGVGDPRALSHGAVGVSPGPPLGGRRGRRELAEDRGVGARGTGPAATGPASVSGTRLASDSVVDSDSHWMSW